MHLSNSFLKPKTSKGILLGEASVGKTALIERIVNNNFTEMNNVILV